MRFTLFPYHRKKTDLYLNLSPAGVDFKFGFHNKTKVFYGWLFWHFEKAVD